MNETRLLPKGWRRVKLGEVCHKPEYGYTASAEEKSVGPKFLRITDIQDGDVNWNGVPYCKCDNDAIPKYLLKSGDILFARTGGTTGKSYLIREVPPETIFASYLIRVRTTNELIPEYLYLFLQSDKYWNQVENNKRGGAQPNMNATLLSNIVLPMPSVPEQRRIAAKVQELMAEVDHARTACEAQLEAAKALPAAYLRQVFESEEAKRWERKNLGGVCEVIMGQSPPGYTYNKEGNGLPFYQGKIEFGNIYPMPPSTWCTEPKKVAEPGDVLISVRAPVGPTNLCRETCCIGRGLTAIRAKNYVIPLFILHFLRLIERELSEVGRGSTFGAIKKKDIDGIQTPRPPLPIQERIASELKEKMANVEKLRTSIEAQLQAVKTLPQAILRKAFSGEL